MGTKENPVQMIAPELRPAEKYDRSRLHGRWRDEVFERGPDGADRLIEKADWRDNLIVTGMSKLLAGLMANEPTFLGGILWHAQGRGQSSWDMSLPAPAFPSTQLVDEFFRKAPDSLSYLDPVGAPSPTLTNSVLIRTTLDYGEANGLAGEFIREQGLYGGTATGAVNSGLLANLIYHKARFKNSGVKIIRYVNFQF